MGEPVVLIGAAVGAVEAVAAELTVVAVVTLVYPARLT
jgi:hypothetical protein